MNFIVTRQGLGQARPNKITSEMQTHCRSEVPVEHNIFKNWKFVATGRFLLWANSHTFEKSTFQFSANVIILEVRGGRSMKKEIDAFVNAANEQELEAAWNNLSAEEQRVFEQLMEEEPPEDALAFFAQLYDDTPKEQASETVSISENEIYFKRQPLTEEQKKHGSYVDENGNLHVKNQIGRASCRERV